MQASKFTLNVPAARGAAAGIAAAGLLWLVKPSPFFDEKGNARLWSVVTSRSDLKADTTAVPWYLAAAAVATGVLIFS
jgi:hypothetical protein